MRAASAPRAPISPRRGSPGRRRPCAEICNGEIIAAVFPAASPSPSLHDIALGKYKLIANLGQGGMADVYLAVAAGSAGISKVQVVKRLREEFAEDAEYLSMFIDEARLAARLNHPNVVQTFDVGREDGEYFLAMEYLEGAPMNRVLARARERPPAPGILLRIVADALAGLHYAHELKDYDGTHLAIVHRDASPHNIFITFDGQTKVVDFGIAKAATRSNETRAGVVKGKVAYMAPEQARCRPLDRRADVFVLGIVLWEVIAGRKMWERTTEADVFQRLFDGALTRLADARPDVSPELARICERALAVDPADRYATAAEMRADLLAYMDRAGLKVSTEDVGAYVAGLFADKREEIKKIIERQLGKLSMMDPVSLVEMAGPVSSNLPTIEGIGSGPVSGTSGRRSGPRSSRSAQGAGSVPPASNPSVQSVPPPASVTRVVGAAATAPALAPAKPNRGPLIVACLAFVVTVGVAVIFLKRKEPEPVGSTAESAAVAPSAVAPSPSPDTAAEPKGTAAPNGTMIELRIQSSPRTADLFLDGARLPSNPFTGKFPADGIGHRVHAEAEDHRTTAKIVVFDRDASIEIALEPKKGVASLAGGGSPAREQPKVEEPAAPPPVSAAPEEPSLSAAKTGKPKRQLDSSEPWSTPAATSGSAKPKRKLDSSPW